MTGQATFDANVLETLRSRPEVSIRTSRNPRRPVTIWIVVVDDAVFVRSVQGPRGKWYLAAKADGEATLVIGQQELPVRVTPVTDPVAVDAVSRAILSKYAASPYAKTMVSDETVPTTLRLDAGPPP
ncbi:MAG TPA: DUF2255 family protein [Acetobacteraceae bacterium]